MSEVGKKGCKTWKGRK